MTARNLTTTAVKMSLLSHFKTNLNSEPQAKVQFSQSVTPHIPVVWWVASQVFVKACVRRRVAGQKVFLGLPMSQTDLEWPVETCLLNWLTELCTL